MGLFDTAAS